MHIVSLAIENAVYNLQITLPTISELHMHEAAMKLDISLTFFVSNL